MAISVILSVPQLNNWEIVRPWKELNHHLLLVWFGRFFFRRTIGRTRGLSDTFFFFFLDIIVNLLDCFA